MGKWKRIVWYKMAASTMTIYLPFKFMVFSFFWFIDHHSRFIDDDRYIITMVVATTTTNTATLVFSTWSTHTHIHKNKWIVRWTIFTFLLDQKPLYRPKKKKKTLSSSSSGLVIVNYEHVMTLKTLDLDVLLGGQLNDAQQQQQQQQTPFTSLDKKITK